jgi:hypothetical protein
MMSDTVDLTLYLVGDTKDEAEEGLPFDDYPLADEYRRDNGYKTVWAITATMRFSTMRIEDTI